MGTSVPECTPRRVQNRIRVFLQGALGTPFWDDGFRDADGAASTLPQMQFLTWGVLLA
jgi:hypothetical protein